MPKIITVTGKPWDQKLDGVEQDYLVCPDPPWLDGINAGDGYIRQFIAMPLGMGYTVEGQISCKYINKMFYANSKRIKRTC